ncbi:hypothetical protein PF010_g31112 [Phytophthora fragariae]|uniref:Uncharacterized protein n=1 Tax=Phytophthora fragariae TaxID=53985 RepID=A0A6G0JJ71_9STRA|nr:hypothetical protein PF010_g31112 [Phytophthora fragariae]
MITEIVTSTTMDDVTTKDDVMRTDARHHVDKRRMQVVSGPVGTVVLTMVTEDVKTTVVMVIRGVNLLVTDHHLLNTAVTHADTGTEVQSPRITASHVGLVTVLHPQFMTNTSTVIRLRDTMIVDTIHSIMPAHHRSTAMLGRHSSMETNKAHPSGLVINVDHHPDGATRRHVAQETSLRREDVDAHYQQGSGRPDERRGRSYDRRGDGSPPRRDSYGSPHFPQGGGRQSPKPRDEPRERGYFVSALPPAPPRPSAAQWRTKFQEGEKDLIAAHIRDKGMSCVRRGDGTYEYKFERNRASNSGEEEDSDEGGSSGVLVITRDDIIANINKNPKMAPQQPM